MPKTLLFRSYWPTGSRVRDPVVRARHHRDKLEGVHGSPPASCVGLGGVLASDDAEVDVEQSADGPLGAEYVGLAGQDLLRKLGEDNRADVLEAFWRLANDEVQAEAAPYLAMLDLPELNGLLLDRVFDPEVDNPPANAVLEAIKEHRPQLTPACVDRLVDRLMNPEELSVPIEDQRSRLEIWALCQRGPRIDQFVRAVIAKETPQHGNEHVREEAIARCQEDEQLRRSVYAMLTERLRTEPSEEEWENASSFLVGIARERLDDDGHSALLAQMLTVLTQLPGTADARSPAKGSSSSAFPIPTRVKTLAQRLAFRRLRQILEGERLDTEPPRIALAEMALTVSRRSWRWAALKSLVVHQPDLWAAVWSGRAESWTDEDWRGALEAVLSVADRLEGSRLAEFVAQAPPACSDLCMQIALRFGSADLDPLTQAATDVLRARVEELLEGETQELTASSGAFWWPQSPGESDRRALKALLSPVPPERYSDLVVDSLASHLIDPATAAVLLDTDSVEAALASAQGNDRERLARACYARDPETTVAAVEALQNDALSLELVTALAEHAPDVAFAPVAQVWSGLESSIKDAIVDLLDKHATPRQRQLLEKIAEDTLSENAARRRRAVVRLSVVVPTGGDVPPAILEAIGSGRAEDRKAAVGAIRKIRPRSREAVEALRRLTSKTAPGRDAKEALRELAEDYVNEIVQDPSQDRRIEFLQLLGATGQTTVIDPLLDHLGQDAVDDHATVRIAAAQALKEVATDGEFSPEQQRAVGALLDEEGGEDNDEAREVLSAALTELTLGQDKALTILHELVAFAPKGDPDALFGPQKPQLIRHLQLYNTERSRGNVARPQRLMQLDLISEKLLRAAYLRVGTSSKLKEKIVFGGKEPGLGELLPALETVSELQKSRADLAKLHDLRCEKTEYAHSGDQPSPDDETTALTCFKSGAKRLLGVLEAHASEPWPT